MKQWILGISAAALLLGCASTNLGPVAAVNDSEVQIVDKRIASEKKHYRQGPLTPFSYMGDEDFGAPPVSYLKVTLLKKKPSSIQTANLEMTKFRIGDYFPHRQSAAIAGGLAGALGPVGYAAFASVPPDNSDGVVCILEGNLNGKPIKTTVFASYKISPFAGMVRTQPEFIAAVRESIDRCAGDAYQQIR